MIRLVINGCHGRMGQTLIKFIEGQKDQRVVAGIDPRNPVEANLPFPVYSALTEMEEEADVIIDFSNPQGISALLEEAARRALPVVIATTGLSEDVQGAVNRAAEKIAVFQSPNMSLGINLLRELIKRAAAVLGGGYDVEIIEKHHRMKKDAPSGTAFLLANAINEGQTTPYAYAYGRRETAKRRDPREMGLHALRGGTIVGEHEVIFAGEDEVVEISHRAYSRKIFASGAVQAARYIAKRAPGLYTMTDMIEGIPKVGDFLNSQVN